MTRPIDRITTTAPAKIYLDLPDDADFDPSDVFKDFFEVTWSEDCATGVGIPYVRADLVPTPAASGAAPADIQSLKEKINEAIRVADNVGRSRGTNPFAMNRGAVEKIVDLTIEIEAALDALVSREAGRAPLTDRIWKYRRYGSPSEKGYTIFAHKPGATHGEAVAFLGDSPEAADAVGRICEAHNAALASPQVAPALSLSTPLESECSTISAFLGDVMTAAGLVEHGKQCKSLAVRMSKACMELRGLVYGATPVQVALPSNLLPTDAMIHAAVNAYETSQATPMVRMRCALSAALARQSTPMQAPAAADDARDAAQPPAVAWIVECWMGSQERGGWVPQFPARQSEDEAKFDMQMFKTPFKRVVSLHRDFHAITPAAKPAEPTLPTQGDAK